jgi:hypothetical protein
MKSKSSREIPAGPQRKDTERELKKAVIRDADKTETADWDKVHGDGDQLGLDEPGQRRTAGLL